MLAKLSVLTFFLLLVSMTVRLQSTPTTPTTPQSIPNCKQTRNEYSSGISCLACNPGYALSDDRKKCMACPTGCSGCENTLTTCSTCFTGYLLEGDVCKSCEVGCEVCTGSTSNCAQCKSGYSLISAKCIQCPANCLTCTTTSDCSTCNKKFYLNPSKVCAGCLENCDECKDGNTCQKCADGLTLNDENGKNVCKKGFFSTYKYIIGLILVSIVIAVVVIFLAIGACKNSSQGTDAAGKKSGEKMETEFGMNTSLNVTVDNGKPQRKTDPSMKPIFYDGER